MILGRTRMGDLSVGHRELLRLANQDPNTTTILSRSIRVEAVAGVATGAAIGLAGGWGSWPPF